MRDNKCHCFKSLGFGSFESNRHDVIHPAAKVKSDLTTVIHRIAVVSQTR